MSIKIDKEMQCSICFAAIHLYDEYIYCAAIGYSSPTHRQLICNRSICEDCFDDCKFIIHSKPYSSTSFAVRSCSYKCLINRCISKTNTCIDVVLQTNKIINHDLETFNQIQNYEKIKTVELWKNCVGILGKNLLCIVKEYLV